MPSSHQLDSPSSRVDEVASETYKFPKGNADVERLELQHQQSLLCLGDIYPEEIKGQVEQLLTQEDSAILDVGCGSCPFWCFQMAERFPKAKIIGLDMAPRIEGVECPRNFSFVCHDLADGFPDDYKNRFSILHCRSVCQHFPDPQRLIKCMTECLKPGGLLLVLDGGFRSYDQDKKPLVPFKYNPALSIEENLKNPEGHSWNAAWFLELGRAMFSPTYRPPPELIRESGLKEVMAENYFMPFGWEGEGIRNGKKVGELFLANTEMVYKFSPVILARLDDIPTEIKEALVARGFAELTKRKMYGSFSCAVGMRPE